MKILLINNTSESVVNFRKEFIKTLIIKGYEVYVICSNYNQKEAIEKLGVKLIVIEFNNRSINIIKDLLWQKKLIKIVNKINPEIIFTFQAKPNIYGGFVAQKCNIKYFSMVEGLGSIFATNSLKNVIIRRILLFLYKHSQKRAEKIFFLNSEDQELFLRMNIIKNTQAVKINGIGIDLEDFAQKQPLVSPIVFLMCARLLPEKGVFEFCEAAKIIKKKYPEVKFLLLGQESEIKKSDLNKYSYFVDYLGHTNNVKEYLEKSSIFVLPSYREGLPRSIMEAMATGRAIITTNSVGCKETVIDNYNGFLIPVKNIEKLAEKMEYFIINTNKIISMGENSRKLCEERFNCNRINQIILNIIEGKEFAIPN